MLAEIGSTSFSYAIVAAAAMGVACALLSVVVVLRRWAFIGEGIAHAGFGGAGTVWLLALALPQLNEPAPVYAGVILFCLAAGWGIGWLTRGRRVNSDAAIS